MLTGKALRDSLKADDPTKPPVSKATCDLCGDEATGTLVHFDKDGAPCPHPICASPQCRLIAVLGIAGLLEGE